MTFPILGTRMRTVVNRGYLYVRLSLWAAFGSNGVSAGRGADPVDFGAAHGPLCVPVDRPDGDDGNLQTSQQLVFENKRLGSTLGHDPLQ